MQAQFTLNQSRIEEITMKEDLVNVKTFLGDDGFGDIPFDQESEKEILRAGSLLDESLHHDNDISKITLDKEDQREITDSTLDRSKIGKHSKAHGQITSLEWVPFSSTTPDVLVLTPACTTTILVKIVGTISKWQSSLWLTQETNWDVNFRPLDCWMNYMCPCCTQWSISVNCDHYGFDNTMLSPVATFSHSYPAGCLQCWSIFMGKSAHHEEKHSPPENFPVWPFGWALNC